MTRVSAGSIGLLCLLASAQNSAASNGDYTTQQARAGQHVFSQHCSECHGSNLQGEAGPPLKGQPFAANLRYGKMSAQQLFDFIKTQMPASAPGSLTRRQYLQALAYILSENGYPAGSTPVSSSTLASIKLLPYPGSGSSHQKGQSNSTTNSK